MLFRLHWPPRLMRRAKFSSEGTSPIRMGRARRMAKRGIKYQKMLSHSFSIVLMTEAAPYPILFKT